MIELLVTIALIGLLVWLFTSVLPLPAPFPKIILVVAIVCVVIIVLRAFGLMPHTFGGSVPQLR